MANQKLKHITQMPLERMGHQPSFSPILHLLFLISRQGKTWPLAGPKATADTANSTRASGLGPESKGLCRWTSVASYGFSEPLLSGALMGYCPALPLLTSWCPSHGGGKHREFALGDLHLLLAWFLQPQYLFVSWFWFAWAHILWVLLWFSQRKKRKIW